MKGKTLGNSEAFASIAIDKEGTYGSTGLTKREYFAAMAMQGIAAEYIEVFETTSTISGNAVAKFSVMLADELINELNK
jgi:hypothetical protein